LPEEAPFLIIFDYNPLMLRTTGLMHHAGIIDCTY
jgi:hypothetical protein